MASLNKCPFRSSAHFLIGHSVYIRIQDIVPSQDTYLLATCQALSLKEPLAVHKLREIDLSVSPGRGK